DYVELNNLQRQWLYDEEDAACARTKAEAAARQLLRLDAECKAEPVVAHLDLRRRGRLLRYNHAYRAWFDLLLRMLVSAAPERSTANLRDRRSRQRSHLVDRILSGERCPAASLWVSVRLLHYDH